MVGESFHHVVAGVRTVTTQIRRDGPKTVAPFRFSAYVIPVEFGHCPKARLVKDEVLIQ